jgi:hypothetical protein
VLLSSSYFITAAVDWTLNTVSLRPAEPGTSLAKAKPSATLTSLIVRLQSLVQNLQVLQRRFGPAGILS